MFITFIYLYICPSNKLNTKINIMTRLQKLVENETPFAVMQYFQSLKSSKQEVNKEYELIFINENNEVAYKILKIEEVSYLKNNLEIIKSIIKNKDGQIFEFNNFKDYK